LLATFDANGSFGLSTTLTNTGGVQTPETAPRATGLSGLNNIPVTDQTGATIFAPAPSSSFPQTFPSGVNGDVGSYAVYWGMDNKLKTPYSYTIDLSVGRQFARDYTLEVAYVGRLSHRLLTQMDVAMPLNWTDPQTGIDYFTAVKALAKIYRTGVPTEAVTDAMIGPTAVYWHDLMGATAFEPGSAGLPRMTCSADSGTMKPRPCRASIRALVSGISPPVIRTIRRQGHTPLWIRSSRRWTRGARSGRRRTTVCRSPCGRA
jgi:hypothetical protein